jgi:hypothetical protein
MVQAIGLVTIILCMQTAMGQGPPGMIHSFTITLKLSIKVVIKFMIMKIVFEQLTCYINPFITYHETSSHLRTYTSKQKIIEQNHLHHYSFYI